MGVIQLIFLCSDWFYIVWALSLQNCSHVICKNYGKTRIFLRCLVIDKLRHIRFSVHCVSDVHIPVLLCREVACSSNFT